MTDGSALAEFHEGRRRAIDEVYRAHVGRVERAVRSVLTGLDAESVTQEVFMRLITTESLRRSFQGGDLGAWLATIARNHALDTLRSSQRLQRLHEAAKPEETLRPMVDDVLDAQTLIERFRTQHVPPKWAGVFELRFLKQLSQEEAAATLRIARTTLAYQELRLRMRLKAFLLGVES